MNKTLFGLAFLSYNWENYNKNIIDSYIPLICSLITDNKYKKVDREIIQHDLQQGYGIVIPLGAVEGILTRMTKNDYLNRESGEFLVVDKKVSNAVNTAKKDELETNFKILIAELQEFSNAKFKVNFSTEEIEIGLISFFRENDLTLLFATDVKSVLPEIKESKKIKYIISKYISKIYTEKPERFADVLKLAKGYSIASLITYDELQHYSGGLKDVQIFLDAPIIFNLLGLNGNPNLKLSHEFIDTLIKNEAKLRLFEINYDEVIKTIQDAIERLRTQKYELALSSRVLRTAVRENYSSQNLQIKLNQVDTLLKKYNIQKVSSINLMEAEYRFQIEEQDLTKIIKDLYGGNNHKIPHYKFQQIERDVRTISDIFKIRKNTIAISLKNCKAILVTTNEVVAFAAKRFEKEEWEFKSSIPVCLTDIFFSTILWTNYPEKSDNLNMRLLMSECYANIELDNKLLHRYYDDIKRMHEENTITDEEFYRLSATNLAYQILEQKTFNDVEEYTDKTPREILNDIQILQDSKLSTIDNNIRKVAHFIGKSIFIFIAILFIGVFIILKVIEPKLDTKYYNYIGWAILTLFGLFGIFRWMDIIPTKLQIESIVEHYCYKKLKDFLSRDSKY